MRSAPTCSGSSTSSVMGRRERPSTTSGRTGVARSTASHSPWVTGGTTDATTAARTSWVERPSWARYDVRVAAHSSGVREGVVVRRQWASRLSPRNSPTFVSVLLMLMASSMARRKYRRLNGLSPRLTGRPARRIVWRLRPTEETHGYSHGGDQWRRHDRHPLLVVPAGPEAGARSPRRLAPRALWQVDDRRRRGVRRPHALSAGRVRRHGGFSKPRGSLLFRRHAAVLHPPRLVGAA